MSTDSGSFIRLRNGRAVGFAEFGDPSGFPVLHFHGFPSSRFEGSRPDNGVAAQRCGARVIVVERPGIGLSDPQPYTIATWPDIVSEFADVIGLDRFAVLGLSAGGKYSAACAWKLPDRVVRAGIISGTCPYDIPGAWTAISRQDQMFYRIASWTPWLLRLVLWKFARDIRKDPYSVLSLFSDVPACDHAVLEMPDVQRVFAQSVAGAFARGTHGVAHDWKLEARPWGFSLGDIRVPVHIWHGNEDTIQPVEHGRILADELSQPHVRFFPEEGHVSVYVNHYEEILDDLLSGGTSRDDRETTPNA